MVIPMQQLENDEIIKNHIYSFPSKSGITHLDYFHTLFDYLKLQRPAKETDIWDSK